MKNLIILILPLILISLIKIVFGSGENLDLLDSGVLRKVGDCGVIFTNFGINKNINNIKLSKKKGTNDPNKFTLKIENLINGNIGPNNVVYLDPLKLKNALKIKQDKIDISDFVITKVTNEKTGLMNMEIYGLSTCSGLIVKQTFIESTLNVANRMYYETVVPSPINKGFDAKNFGPSYSYPLKRIHWKINEGLDELRITCGIYIYYTSVTSSNGYHWQYYISTENGNKKGCSANDFFEIAKRHYTDYESNDVILHENYMGYVLKREGHIEEQMDGILPLTNYLIEIYQKKCNDETESQIICIIPSHEVLSFSQFTEALVNDCLKIKNESSSNAKWEIKN